MPTAANIPAHQATINAMISVVTESLKWYDLCLVLSDILLFWFNFWVYIHFVGQFNWFAEEHHRVHPACDGWISCGLFHCSRESRLFRQSFWEISFKTYDHWVDRFCFGSMTRFGMLVSVLDQYSVLRTDNQFTTACLAAAPWSSNDSKQIDSSSLHLHTPFESASRSLIEPAEVDSWIRFCNNQLPWSGQPSHLSDSQTFIDDQ